MAVVTIGEGGQVTLPAEMLDAVGAVLGDFVSVTVTATRTLELCCFKRYRLEEMLDRFRIEGPIDIEADREAWYAEAAREVLGELGE